MKHTKTPNAGELLAGFLRETIQEQAAADAGILKRTVAQ